MEIAEKYINPFKHIINVDMIESFMIVNNIDKDKFCEMCNIETDFLEDILERRLSWIPNKIFEVAHIINGPLFALLNNIVKKYNIMLFEYDKFRID